MRRAVLIALGRLGDETAVAALVDSAQRDADVPARAWSIESLGLIRAPESVKSLLSFLEADDREVRWAAALALGEMRVVDARAQIVLTMRGDRWWLRRPYRLALRRLGRPLEPGRLRGWIARHEAPISRSYSWIFPIYATGIPSAVLALMISSWLSGGVSYDGASGLILGATVVAAIDLVLPSAWGMLVVSRADFSAAANDESGSMVLAPVVLFAVRLVSLRIAPGLRIGSFWATAEIAALLAVFDAIGDRILYSVRRWRRLQPYRRGT